ncbi:hypothetical protein F5890DRAFT_286201 [Lentinula detonsa]|uniref:WD40 repeat-like protein n=1 Tax=Lentinula detonsa TaxID=2804962 RepID=A0AA38PX92_9AGAR|nr:hypothetical protein F5890DRAFT_286201 [Lentinula detonsa]
MNLPESVLLCLFPNGLVLSRQSAALDGGDGDEEDVYPVDFDPDCFQFVLSFFRNASEAFYGTATSPGLFSAQQHLLEAPLNNFSNLPICHPPSRPTPNESVLDSFGCALNPATTTQSPFLTYLSATHPSPDTKRVRSGLVWPCSTPKTTTQSPGSKRVHSGLVCCISTSRSTRLPPIQSPDTKRVRSGLVWSCSTPSDHHPVAHSKRVHSGRVCCDSTLRYPHPSLSNISLGGSPTKKRTGKTQRAKSSSSSGPFDTSNPFLQPFPSSHSRSRSRPASPVKFATGAIPISEDLKGQAGGGLIRKGSVELSRLNVVSRDYIPLKPEIKRSRSAPAANRDTRDRFITSRDIENDLAATLEQMHLNPKSASAGHTACLVAATGVPLNRRILGYHELPPAASSDTSLAQQREFAKPLYARPGTLPTSIGTSTNKSRKIPTQPERVLDAPGIVDDFYLNLISWSSQNTVAVALEASSYIWHANTGFVTPIGEAPEGTYVSSVDFSKDGTFLGIGLGQGDIELWDVETGQKLRVMSGHQAIWHHDVRVQRHKVMELLGHNSEVCGLKWRSDGELLASGGNDNVVNIWEGRLGDVGEGARGSAKWTKRTHTATVKGLAWCPLQLNLLTSGGGTNDATIQHLEQHYRGLPPYTEDSFSNESILDPFGHALHPLAAIHSHVRTCFPFGFPLLICD